MSSAWCYRRMKRLLPRNPLVKAGNVEDRHLLKVPQFVGNPGWLLLSHNEHGDPIAMFADKQDRVEILYLVMDERLFSDTILRVVKLGPWRYVVYDLPVLNGTPILPEDVPTWDTPVRGYEHYDEAPGSVGVFCPVKE